MIQTAAEKDQAHCPSTDISAYLDCELSPRDEMELESHLTGCGPCRDELNLQKSLLLAIDSALDDEIEIPEEFTRRVVVTAESGVSGLRRRSERVYAFAAAAALLAATLAVLFPDRGRVTAIAVSGFEMAAAIAGSAMHMTFDIALGVVIVTRSLFANLTSESSIFATGVAAAVVAAAIVLSRLAPGQGRP